MRLSLYVLGLAVLGLAVGKSSAGAFLVLTKDDVQLFAKRLAGERGARSPARRGRQRDC